MSKAGPRGLRSALIGCADTARKQDPLLAAIYHQQMTTRNAPHLESPVCGRRPARRAGLGGPGRRPALPATRRRRHAGHGGGSHTDHPRAVHGPAGDPAPPTSKGLRAVPGRPCACPQPLPGGAAEARGSRAAGRSSRRRDAPTPRRRRGDDAATRCAAPLTPEGRARMVRSPKPTTRAKATAAGRPTRQPNATPEGVGPRRGVDTALALGNQSREAGGRQRVKASKYRP